MYPNVLSDKLLVVGAQLRYTLVDTGAKNECPICENGRVETHFWNLKHAQLPGEVEQPRSKASL